MLAKSCILQTDAAGISWKARIKKEKPNYFICEGEWAQFVVYHKLAIGDFLLFFLIDKFTFHVILYSKKHSGNLPGELPFEELSSSSEDEGEGEEEENIEASEEDQPCKLKWISQEPIDISDSEEESVDPTRSSKDGGNPCCSRPGKSDVKADNMLGMKKRVDPPSGSKDGGNPCYSHPGKVNLFLNFGMFLWQSQ
ncbi:B3 domain-containing protein REM9-like [Lycium ferocissimum]|uniref:B3 domain-containing protein REM9-like n=1 Tax=Lycium ferocissimum TaxID=112874 RepID=UPI002816515E|nr:B3 domain-containing protein REM9-like [Lycium ferocissimum]